MSVRKKLYPCSIKICDGHIVSPGAKYCAAHLKRLRVFGNLQVRRPIKRRVWGSKVSKTAEYRAWASMKERCSNKLSPSYSQYGGRGIRVCKRWEIFDNFVFDMGIRPRGHSLERINNSRGYMPSNCKWATQTEQVRNRRNSVTLEMSKKVVGILSIGNTAKATAEAVGISVTVVYKIRNGEHWTVNV